MAVDAHRIAAAENPGWIECVNRHVHDQRKIPLIAKPAEVGANEKIGVNLLHGSDRAAGKKKPQRTDRWPISLRLRYGVEFVRSVRGGNHSPGAFQRVAHWLLAQHMPAAA